MGNLITVMPEVVELEGACCNDGRNTHAYLELTYEGTLYRLHVDQATFDHDGMEFIGQIEVYWEKFPTHQAESLRSETQLGYPRAVLKTPTASWTLIVKSVEYNGGRDSFQFDVFSRGPA